MFETRRFELRNVDLSGLIRDILVFANLSGEQKLLMLLLMIGWQAVLTGCLLGEQALLSIIENYLNVL